MAELCENALQKFVTAKAGHSSAKAAKTDRAASPN